MQSTYLDRTDGEGKKYLSKAMTRNEKITNKYIIFSSIRTSGACIKVWYSYFQITVVWFKLNSYN